MTRLSVAIVIPAYNEASQIKGCLEAISKQSEMPDEVIVVDNNSTDSTKQIALSYPFVTVISESKQGIVYARNAGFNNASSEVIARIDADTRISKDWIKTIKLLAGHTPISDAVSGPCQFRDISFPRIVSSGHRIVYFWSSYFLLNHRTLFGSNMFLWRTAWEELRDKVCLQTDIHEDMDLAVHIVENGGKIHFTNQLAASISARRVHSFGEYPKMWLATKGTHKLAKKATSHPTI